MFLFNLACSKDSRPPLMELLNQHTERCKHVVSGDHGAPNFNDCHCSS